MPADRFLHPRLGHSAKVSSLTHLEARVWTQYILSADDFGVMRYSGLVVQEANDALAREALNDIDTALDKLVDVGLLRAFEHQHSRYVVQHDWQDFQKIEYPRLTFQPKPTPAVIGTCTPKTKKLFAKHPGGTKKQRHFSSQTFPESSPKSSQSIAEGFPTSRARDARAKRLTANGQRLTADGKRLTAEKGARGKNNGAATPSGAAPIPNYGIGPLDRTLQGSARLQRNVAASRRAAEHIRARGTK